MADHLVVVVHGVGDPKPGDALSGLVHGYCAVTGATVDHTMAIEHRYDETHPDATGPGPIPLFPMAKAAVAGDDALVSSLRVFEVYWGDLSRVKGTILGLIEGLVDLVFGVRHVVFSAQRELLHAAASTRLSRMPHVVNLLSTAALWLVRGPLLAFNILAALVTLLYFAAVSLSGQFKLPLEPAHLATAGASIIALGLGLVAYRTAKRLHWSTSTAECTVMFSAVCLFVAVILGDQKWSIDRVEDGLTSGLSVFALPLAVTVLGMLIASACTAIALDDRIGYDEAIRRAGRRALVVINACTILSCALFVFIVMVAWSVLISQSDDGKKAAAAGAALMKPLRQRIEDGLHLFGLIWVFFIGIGLVYAALMWRSQRLKQKAPPPERFPRYIVHPVVVTLLLIVGAVSAAAFIPLILQLECEQYFGKGHRRCAELAAWVPVQSTISSIESLNKLGLVLSGALVTLLVAARVHLGTALDIALDVISHFKQAERTGGQVFKDTGVRVGKHRWALLAVPEHSEWNAMVGRFRNIVELAMRSAPGSPLTILAHSQGTMIALEALGVITIDRTDRASSERRVSAAPADKVRLITMGCPLTDLYLHYFPGKYRIATVGESLVDEWINVYRADDFVGTSVATADPAYPRNVKVGPRGHTNYWIDREVLARLVPYLAPPAKS